MLKEPNNLKTAVLKCLAMGIGTCILMSLPIFGIKWGASHRDFAWHHFFLKIIHAKFAPTSSIWQESFAIQLPWQEKSAVMICALFAAYIAYQIAFNISADISAEFIADFIAENSSDSVDAKSNADENTEATISIPKPVGNITYHQRFQILSYAFLFLYVSACTVCERTNIGMIPADLGVTSIIRDLGLVLLLIILFLLSRAITTAASFNGMLTRADIAHAYHLLVAALAGIAMAFSAWLPLFALPGALIMARFGLNHLKEMEEAEASILTI